MRLLDTPETGDTSARGGRQARAETSGGGTTSATCVATWPSPTGIWRGSDDPDSHKWVPNVGSRCYVGRNVSSIHAADPHLTCRRSLIVRCTLCDLQIFSHGVKERPHSGERNGDVSNGVPSPEYGQINWFSASPKTCSREGFPSDTCVSFQILAKAF